jgi:Cu-processing system permease protein
MNPTLIIAHLTFREASRRRIVQTALLLGAGFLLIYSVGFHMVIVNIGTATPQEMQSVARTEGVNFLVLAGLYAVTFLSIAMAALLSADTLAGEISSGTIQAVVTKPLDRVNVVLGKWLGFAGLLGLYLVLMGGGVVASVWLQTRYAAPHALAGLALIYLESLLIMSVAMMCSSRLTALATGGVVFGLYGLAFIGGWIEQIGSFLQSQTAVYVGIVTSLIIPSEALWKRAAYEMQSPISGLLGMSPFSAVSVPSLLMVFYAGIYTLGALVLAVRIFTKRDL